MARRGLLGESIATAALAGLLFGFDTAVVAGVTADWRVVFGLNDASLGLTVSAAIWGTLAGALCAGLPGDRYGARNVLRVLAGFYVLSALVAAFSWGLGSLVAARFVTGLAIGGSSVLAPVYIAEIAPPAKRGRLVGLFQLMVVSGILVAFLSNAVVGEFASDATAWRWKLGVPTLPALLFLGLLFRIPDSPRWLIARGRDAEARAGLELIGVPHPEVDLQAIRQGISADADARTARLSWTMHRKPIMLAVLLAGFNQLAGINAILYYSNDIFHAAGFGRLSADLQTIAVGATNLAFTLVGIALIDRIGRKTLLLIGAIGMAVCLAVVAGIFWGLLPKALLIVMLVGYIAFFAPSQGAVIWVYLSEIFPTRVRARGMGIGSSTHWLMNAIIAGIFPVIARHSTAAPFLFFAAMMALQFVVVLLFFPETKGVALEKMDAPDGESVMRKAMLFLGLGALIGGAASAQIARDPNSKFTMDWNDRLSTDWAYLAKYRDANAQLAPAPKHPRIVFMGDSITEGWVNLAGGFFTSERIGRGISGQTTPQMLGRFRQDVIDLHPSVVQIMAGTNDIAGNTGPMSVAETQGNIRSMVELAHAHGIRVILASIPPADQFPWKPQLETAHKIVAMNAWLKAYAARSGCIYADYWNALKQNDGLGMRDGLSSDHVHPTKAGYQVMAPVAEGAIRRALALPAPRKTAVE